MPSWKETYAARMEMRRQYPDPLSLPLVKRPEALVSRVLPDGSSLLDVGSGDGSFGAKCEREGRRYEMTTIDPGGGADHTTLDSAQGPFDGAVMLELIEHLSPEEGWDLTARVKDLVRPGGPVILSTPNIFLPGQFLKDRTHITAYAWDELGALCTTVGMRLEGLYRVYNAPALGRFLHLGVGWWLHRFLGVDVARSIMAVARVPG